MRRHWFAILAIVCVLTIVIQPFTPYTATAAFVALLWGGCIAIALKIVSWLAGRQERARLLADADAQHAAWRRGDDRLAVHGRFPPPVGKFHAKACRCPECVEWWLAA